MNAMRVTTLGSVLCVLLASASARADGVCNKVHAVSATERATMSRTLEAARTALPQPPAEWVIVSDDEISVPGSFCMDRPGPLTYAFHRLYGNRSPQKQQASEQATADAAAVARADLAQKQPKLDALMARMNALTQQAIKAGQARDHAKVESVNREMETVSNEYAKLLGQGDAAAQMEAAGAESLRDIEMNVAVRVNPAKANTPPDAKAFAAPTGARAAMKWSTTREGVTGGHALLLIGPWKQNPPGHGWSPAAGVSAPTVAAGWYAIEIHADPRRLEPLALAIDSAALAATIAR